MELIDWKVLFEEDMKEPGFKEEFDFACKEIEAELAAERAQRQCHAAPPRAHVSTSRHAVA